MSHHFTYEIPDQEKYHQSLLVYLKKKGENDLYSLLRKAKCSISTSGRFSEKRWNARYTTVIFQIPLSDFERVDDVVSKSLISYCDLIMPTEAGFDVMNVEFTPLIDVDERETSLEDDLEDIKSSLQNIQAPFPLPDDLMGKGREMTEAYLYLYVVENYLRVFIEKIAEEKYGADYFKKLTIPADVAKGIEKRKKQEAKNKWISIRGDKPLFYLDFKDLGTLILNNWELFKNYFPQQSWIDTKIDEMADCRNLVAHNSYIDKHERDIIRINFNSIIKQIGSALSK
jgi:hypothetical protein